MAAGSLSPELVRLMKHAASLIATDTIKASALEGIFTSLCTVAYTEGHLHGVREMSKAASDAFAFDLGKETEEG